MGLGKFDIEVKDDGKVTVSVADTGELVERIFGALMHEMFYTFDAENIAHLKKMLADKYPDADDSLRKLIIEEFGERLEKHSFRDWLDENGIEYTYHFWDDYDL